MIAALVRNLTALLFPETVTSQPLLPSPQPRQYHNTIFLLPYTNESVSTTIKQNKYHRNKNASKALAQILDIYLSQITNDFAIITLPQSYTRWRERGFDHLAEILRYSQYRHQQRSDVLYKNKHTPRQAHVNKEERNTQQLKSFTYNKTTTASLPKTVVLFDDVITSGATMEAARLALQPQLNQDTQLICLTLAH